jgi:KDO2-lipid IV(A) lauroyltransferase
MGFSGKAGKATRVRDYGGVMESGVAGFLAGRLVVALLVFARWMPIGLVYGFGAILIRAVLPFAPHIRGHVSRNLKMLLGDDIAPHDLKRLVNENIRNTFSRKWVDIFTLTRLSRAFFERNVEITGLEHYQRAIAEGRGVLLITHHVGSYGILAGIVLPCLGNPSIGGARRIFDEKTEAALTRVYCSQGGQAANPGDSLRRFLALLKSGGTVMVAGDHLTSPKGIKVKYFGRETLVPGGPATLACRYNPVALPGICVWTGPRTFRVEFGAPFPVPESGTMDEDERLRVFTRQYLRYFEDVVRRYPEQWECFFRIWPDSFEQGDVEAFCKDYGVNL